MTRRSILVLLASLVTVACSATIALAASIIKGSTWFPIGPAPISGGYGGVAAGRAAVLAVNPDNPDHVFLGSATGGVWFTPDGGLAWTPIGDNAPALAIGAIALDPAHCNAQGCDRIYVGTGENNLRRDTFYGRGLLIGTPASGIAGVWSWQPKGETLFSLASVIDVVLDPTTAGVNKRIYVAVSSGVTASATESTITGPEPAMGFGIYKSENDGDTWGKVSVPDTGGAKPTDLEMDPQDSNLLFAGFLGKGIFKGVRDPMTGTIAWCPLNPGTGGAVCPGAMGLPSAQSSPFDFVEITVHHPGGGSAVLYAVFGNCPDPICEGCNPRIFKSTDGGTVWNEQNGAAPISYSRYTHVLTTHPADHTKVVYGGLGLYLSFNSAADFDSNGSMGDDDIVAKGGGNQIHPDQQDIVFADPSGACTMMPCTLPDGGGAGNCVIYAATDGGLYRSVDGGCRFASRNDGLQITGLQSIAASPDTPVVLGGTQDNGTLYFAGSSTWAYKTGGDTCGTIIDLATPTRTYDITVPGCGVGRTVERSVSGGSDIFWPTAFTTPNNQDASFYPPMVQDPTSPFPLYLGTTKLYRGTNQGTVFSDVSPSLGGNMFFSDIQRTNVITAIGVAPGNPDRIYIGFYDGQIWVSGSGGPCGQMSCWTLVSMGKGLPATAVTWIAVHPEDEDTAYAAFSGFFSGPHLYKTESGGTTWVSASGAGPTMLPNVPVNTVAIEPSEPTRIWVGTDSAPMPHLGSVYKSTNAGTSWVKFSNGLPNVPIFELEILEKPGQGNTVLGQVYAATHGRGVFILTQPNITNFEGWVNGMIWDVPVYGDGFPKNKDCTMQILQSNGTVCAQGMIDARGGTIETNAQGKLTSSAPNYMGQDVVWACYVGTCVDGTPIGDCNDDETGDGVPDLLSTVLVECGGVLGIDKVLGCPDQFNPPASVLSLDEVLGGPVAGAAGVAGAAMQTFHVTPIVQDGDGASRVLCDVPVVHAEGDPAQMTLETARDAINNDPSCQAESVKARVPAAPGGPAEDVFQKPVLGIEAPNVSGGQIMLGVRVEPGQDTGMCFNLQGLGATALKQILIPRLKFSTAAGGAMGGSVRLIEHSPLGACDLTVPTNPGDTPAAIIAAFDAMFQAPGIPGPHPACPSSRNARDAMLHGGDSLIFSLATGLVICADDPGVGFLVAPKEICFTDTDCDDGNPCTQDACLAAARKCENRPVQDGTPCQDHNACTVEDFCRDGACGVPVICDDQDPCTIDHCDPATGECRFTPLICNDGNECTMDLCDRRVMGGCLFSPLTGQTCDDGEACTAGDTCVQSPAGGPPSCQGSPVLCPVDNPCTVGTCDPNTGQCLVSPRQCDDGNICTRDLCDPGVGGCVFVPATGDPCSDGDRCTLNDRCVQDATGAVRCVGDPLVCDDLDRCTVDFCDPQAGLCRFVGVDCDDQDPCTADACSPDTGLCEHRTIALLEVTPVQASRSILLEWAPTSDATHWNTYRGTIPATMLGSRPPGAVYDHVCFESDDAAGDGATSSTDSSVPPAGTAYYYDMTGEGLCGEGPFGIASSGLARPMLIPCPTPP